MELLLLLYLVTAYLHHRETLFLHDKIKRQDKFISDLQSTITNVLQTRYRGVSIQHSEDMKATLDGTVSDELVQKSKRSDPPKK